jgi:Protein of unknown function (DUF3558)
MRPLVLLTALAVLVSVSACTTSQAGAPRATQSGTQAPPSTTSGEASLPPRPASLPLDGVDPCVLITEQQRAAFAIDQPPRPNAGSSGPLKDAPGCSYSTSAGSANDYGFLIIASTTIGLAEYMTMTKSNPGHRMTEVSGFPAVRYELPAGSGNDACFIDVDVADGQLLNVQFGQVASTKPLPMETLCDKAAEVAEAALITLQRQR